MSTLATTITAVTVFPDQARVTRTGTLNLELGRHTLIVEKLPPTLKADSVRARGRGTARAKLLGVSVRQVYFTETPAVPALELEKQLQALQDADAERLAQIAVLEKAQTALDKLAQESATFARGLSFRNRPPEEQGALYDFITRRLAALQLEVLRLQRERREAAKEMARLKHEIDRQAALRPRQRWQAEVEVEVTSAGELTIELTYGVNQAAWSPVYDVRLGDTQLELTYLAEVHQRTGEDWPHVTLTLSTVRPSVTLTAPELKPWYIQPKPPLAPPQARSAKMMAMPAPAPAAMATYGAVAEEADLAVADMSADDAVVNEAGAALTYTLGASADIPSDGTPRKVTVGVLNLKPDMTLVAAPKLEAACYRRAKTRNTTAYTLLPGAAQLFEGDDYLGATRFDFTAPNQEMELFLGVDDRVKVERELTQREVDKNFLGDKRRIRYGYKIKLSNTRATPASVLVRDQLPVSRDEQIRVKLDSTEPRPINHSDLNLLEWALTVPASGTLEVRYEFTAEAPRSMEVLGLP